MLHSVSPISLSATYLNLFCPVPLSLLGDRLFIRFWVIFISILIEVGYSRFPNAPETHPKAKRNKPSTMIWKVI